MPYTSEQLLDEVRTLAEEAQEIAAATREEHICVMLAIRILDLDERCQNGSELPREWQPDSVRRRD